MKNLLAAAILYFSAISAIADPIDNANARIAAEQQAQDDEIAAVSKIANEILADLPAANDPAWNTPDISQPWPQAPELMDSAYHSTEIIITNPFAI